MHLLRGRAVHGHHVKREDGALRRDKCCVCGKKRWCCVYDIDVQEKDDED